jgi:hypothetical protein
VGNHGEGAPKHCQDLPGGNVGLRVLGQPFEFDVVLLGIASKPIQQGLAQRGHNLSKGQRVHRELRHWARPWTEPRLGVRDMSTIGIQTGGL